MKKPFTLRRPELPAISLSGSGLKWAGTAFMTMSLVSASVLQRGVFRMDTVSGEALYESMALGSGLFGLASLAAIFSLLGTLALPIYPMLVLEGWRHTGSVKRYALRMAVTALIAEPLYDYALCGRFLELSVQNPLWSLLLCLVMLELMEKLGNRPGAAGAAAKVLVLVGAMAWSVLLKLYGGLLLTTLAALYYLTARRKAVMLLGGLVLTAVQFPAPLGLLAVYWYDGQPGSARRKLFYIYYPALLLACGAATALLLRFT